MMRVREDDEQEDGKEGSGEPRGEGASLPQLEPQLGAAASGRGRERPDGDESSSSVLTSELDWS